METGPVRTWKENAQPDFLTQEMELLNQDDD